MKAFAVVGFTVAAALVAGGAASVASAAGATHHVPETGDPGMLWLQADPYPADDLEIAPGEHILWPVTANLSAPTSGDLTLEISAADPLATDVDGLRVQLSECVTAWVIPADHADGGECTDGSATTIIPDGPFALAHAHLWELGTIAPGVPRYFLATLFLPEATPGDLATESAEIGFGFRAGDDTVVTALADTGASLVGPLLLAAGVLLAGATARLAGRRR